VAAFTLVEETDDNTIFARRLALSLERAGERIGTSDQE
jgi:hypothetical protein